MMEACYRGGLKSPRIVQEGLNEATILSLVSTGLGPAWASAGSLRSALGDALNLSPSCPW